MYKFCGFVQETWAILPLGIILKKSCAILFILDEKCNISTYHHWEWRRKLTSLAEQTKDINLFFLFLR